MRHFADRQDRGASSKNVWSVTTHLARAFAQRYYLVDNRLGGAGVMHYIAPD